VGRTLVVGPPAVGEAGSGYELVAADGDLADNLERAAAACTGETFVLIVSADIPFVTPEAIDDYVRRCLALDVDCAYAAVPLDACLERFPAMRRTTLRTPAGSFTGGNVVLQRLSTLKKQLDLLRKARRSRKSPLFLARLIGVGNLLRFGARRLTLEHIEEAASRRMGVRCRLVRTPYAELGADVDRAEELRVALEMLHPPEAAHPEVSDTRQGGTTCLREE
jgi:2-phospho-L-lactate guanylyltransferase (CobY/MobA/RfbA family)